ncbi:unnamed protein product [Dimorphilus gyrociliatus]|uniref:Uncharacterized protein n=1 Tax=Dimorphilus gyrociliatus TaxID=2664684 RepID=A0A7I8WDQ3_9ANNE|nr:unnamed protein product [Dimorphilus gyrociliatus]
MIGKDDYSYDKPEIPTITIQQSTTVQTNQVKCEIVNGQKIVSTELKSSTAVAVEKSNHFLGEMHLDVGLRVEPKDYNEMGGLIGDIGKKQYKFY